MSSINITPREQELLRAVIEVMKADIDWPTVAEKANYNTAKQARDKWPSVRAKLIGGGGGDGSATPAKTPKASSKKAKATPSKRKGSSEEDDEEATPSKPKKAKKSTTGTSDGEQETKIKGETGDDEDFLS